MKELKKDLNKRKDHRQYCVHGLEDSPQIDLHVCVLPIKIPVSFFLYKTCLLQNLHVKGCLGDLVSWALILDFGSGHDLWVCEFEPHVVGILSLSKINTLKKNFFRDTWVAQQVKRPTLAQVMSSRFMRLSPVSGSVLTARSLEPALGSVSPSLFAPPLLTLCLSLSLKNKH